MSGDEMRDEANNLREVLDLLPIFAVRVGYRTDSTDEERRVGDAAFAAHAAWKRVMAGGAE